MYEVEEVQFKILDAVEPLQDREIRPLEQCHGKILATDIVSGIDVPPADNSAMDGYALFAQDDLVPPFELPVSARITAGQAPQGLKDGTAARIFTGAELPTGADAVVMQEDCEELDGDRVRVLIAPTAGDNVRRRGQDVAAGSPVLHKGQRLAPQHLGLLASIGLDKVRVAKPVKVALMCTGDELQEPGTPLQAGKIYNSNMMMLRGLLESFGCEVSAHKAVADKLEATKQILAACAEQADLVISSGGVSVGEEDHVKAAVNALGELDIWKVKLKPGKPLVFGRVGSTPFLGLPGNPVSAYVTFLLFAVPVIRKLMGRRFERPSSFYLTANFDINRPQSRPEYLRVRIRNQRVERFPNQSSGVLTSVCWANALALIPAQTLLRRGDLVEVFPLSTFLD